MVPLTTVDLGPLLVLSIWYFSRRHSSVLVETDSPTATACCSCQRSLDNTNCCDKLTWFLSLIGGEAAVNSSC